MIAVLQRVTSSSVTADNEIIGKIGKGLNILLGVEKEDTEKEADYLINKIINLRIFEDEKGKTNLSLQDVKGEMLIISQFTLLANTNKGKRPSFERAGDPVHANSLYEYFLKKARETGIKTEQGRFGADMKVEISNDGPFTIILNS